MDEPTSELDQLRRELERLGRENAELRARLIFDEQLGSDAARYEVIVSHLAEGVVLQGADGQILTCNAAAERILGLSVEQMAGRSSLDPRWQSIHEDGSVFPGETHPAMVSLRTGLPAYGVIMGVHKPDGSLTWISINSQPLFEPGGKRPYAVVTSFVDITAHKRSEARARESEDKLRFALHAARMGIWDWDIRTGEVRWSADVEGILGLERGSFAQTYDAYLSLVHPGDRHEFEAKIQRSIARDGDNRDERSDDFFDEHRVLAADGSTHWVGSFGRVIRDERGEPVRMAGTVTDISAQKSLEQQLTLSQRMETVGRLAGGVAHDFNNLLTAILGSADLASLHPGLSPELREALDIIREAAERASGLTRQLLSFARRQVLDLEVFDLEELVANTERLLSRIIGENIQIRTHLSGSVVPIRADRAQIEQVLINLAVNARDAMPHGGPLDIEVGLVTVDGSLSTSLVPGLVPGLVAGHYALLEVRDRGLGIEESALPHIFDPFFTTKKDGTGLGLSTCYGIVTQLGGEILVDSEPGEGTHFAIYLPLASEGIEGVVNDDARSMPARKRGRILLAEDEAVVRMVAERGLRAHGYEVLTASDGSAALELLAKSPGTIDLLVSDVVMPNMTGYELAYELRALLPGLKVLFVSGYTDAALERQGACERIADAAFLPKPYTVSRLAEVVGQLLASTDPRDPL